MRLLAFELSRKLILAIAFLYLESTNLEAATPELRFSEIQERILRSPVFVHAGFAVSPNGSIYCMTSDKREIYVLNPGDGSVRKLRIRGLPQSVRDWQLNSEVAADRNGCLYIPGYSRQWSLKNEAPNSCFGVVVLKPDGRYQRTIRLDPSVNARHVVPDDSGDLFILGVDLASLYHTNSQCQLGFRYSVEGTRLRAFSPCPLLDSQRGPNESPGRVYFKRHQSARAGQLFIYDRMLYHVLHPSQLIRAFDMEGNLVREVKFLPPETGAIPVAASEMGASAKANIKRVVLMRHCLFLTEWEYIEHCASRPRKSIYVSIHDRSGRALSPAVRAPGHHTMLLSANRSGEIYFLDTTRNGAQMVLRARIVLDPPEGDRTAREAMSAHGEARR